MRLIHAATQQMEPTLGPAISDFKSDSRNTLALEHNILSIGDSSFVGFSRLILASIGLRIPPQRRIQSSEISRNVHMRL